MKSARDRMHVVNAYLELGSYWAAAKRCGTTHKTVRRIDVTGRGPN
jgi:Homeodomain-like domain